MNSFIELFWSKKEELWILFLQHINMTTIAVLISLAVGVPVGILITRNKTAAGAALTIANLMQSIPCLALLAISVIFIGIGTKPAIMMVFVYAFLPILKNTYTGIMSVDPKNIEVARGIGLSRWKCLFEIEIPIAAPFIMSGIRIAAVAAVGTMTIAAFAGAKGLGWFINLGLNSLNYQLILLGARGSWLRNRLKTSRRGKRRGRRQQPSYCVECLSWYQRSTIRQPDTVRRQ